MQIGKTFLFENGIWDNGHIFIYATQCIVLINAFSTKT
jgi:hypothetical protein